MAETNNRNVYMKKLLILLLGIVLASFGAVSYVKELLAGIPEESMGFIPPDFLLGLLMVVQLAILGALGLWLGKKAGIETPALDAIAGKRKQAHWPGLIATAAAAGAVIGGILLAADYLFYRLGSELSLFTSKLPVWYKGLAGSFYGGIGEEIIFRLFFMSLVVLAFNGILKKQKATASTVWPALIFAAILFSLAHLPVTASLTTLTAIVVVRAIALNTIPGIAFGLMYWKKGILFAMIAHFFADIILHVLAVLLIGA